MKDEPFSKLVMNPIRMRIIQYLILHETGTASQIGEELNDVPKASLYRHIKRLENAKLLFIVQENKKRGTVEKVYKLNPSPLSNGNETEIDQISNVINGTLLKLLTDFQLYFQKENVDLAKDMISFTSSTLLLSDEEFTDFYHKIGELFNEVIGNKPDETRKLRRISLISSPVLKDIED